MPAFDVAVKCTCGCGDAFNAGFAVGLVNAFLIVSLGVINFNIALSRHGQLQDATAR